MGLAAVKAYDTYGHPNDPFTQINSGFTAATSGTAAATVVNTATADPTGTTNLAAPWGCSDGHGLFQITTAGTQTTGSLRTIYFNQPYAYVPVAFATVSTTTGAAAGGTITTTITGSSLNVSIGSALTTATTYNVHYVVL